MRGTQKGFERLRGNGLLFLTPGAGGGADVPIRPESFVRRRRATANIAGPLVGAACGRPPSQSAPLPAPPQGEPRAHTPRRAGEDSGPYGRGSSHSVGTDVPIRPPSQSRMRRTPCGCCAAVGSSAALRMRRTPCGCCAPRNDRNGLIDTMKAAPRWGSGLGAGISCRVSFCGPAEPGRPGRSRTDRTEPATAGRHLPSWAHRPWGPPHRAGR